MMEVLLITGFLGAGKTTLIQHLLRSEFNAQEKVAVIVNEVGEIGIDGTLLASKPFRRSTRHITRRIWLSRPPVSLNPAKCLMSYSSRLYLNSVD
jgi:putative protein kinase ArgK-like GTPase of G3E family